MVKNPPLQVGDTRDAGNAKETSSILGRQDSLEKSMIPSPVFLPGESHGQRSLAGYSPWGHKESDMTEQLHKLLKHGPAGILDQVIHC